MPVELNLTWFTCRNFCLHTNDTGYLSLLCFTDVSFSLESESKTLPAQILSLTLL